MRSLFIKQKVFKFTDHYPVLDEAGNEVYYVDEEFRFFKKTFHVTDANRNPIFTINNEITFFLPRYTVRFANGHSISLQKEFTFFRKKITIDSGGLGYQVLGDFFSLNFKVVDKSNRVIGRMYKKWLSWGDSYVLEVERMEDEPVFLAICIAIDKILDDEQSSASSNN